MQTKNTSNKSTINLKEIECLFIHNENVYSLLRQTGLLYQTTKCVHICILVIFLKYINQFIKKSKAIMMMDGKSPAVQNLLFFSDIHKKIMNSNNLREVISQCFCKSTDVNVKFSIRVVKIINKN